MYKIGIPATSLGEEFFGVKNDLLYWISLFGEPVILNPTDTSMNISMLRKLSGLVLPGGADVNVERYNEAPGIYLYRPDPFLEYFDRNTLVTAIEMNIPIFGICRGLQTINVAFGGTLKQHIFHPHSNDAGDLVHSVVNVRSDDKFKVNSFHHQAIDNLGNGVSVEMISEGDGIIEAISVEDKKIFAVQWHPERMFDDYSGGNFLRILSQ